MSATPERGVEPQVHPIEAESYRRLGERIDLSHLPPITRAVVERAIHATADLSFADSLVVDEETAATGAAALAAGAPVVTDVEMVRAGIAGSLCYLGSARTSSGSADDAGGGPRPTLSARAIRLAAREHPDGAVWAIGCAPTALDELVTLVEAGSVRPAFVIGTPVGYVGAADAKERLRSSPSNVPSISNVGERGGSAVAAAIVNALRRCP